MERSRSALARHRKRKLVEATQHVSSSQELAAVVAMASSVSIDRLTDFAPLDAVNDAIRVLRNTKNSVYHRALAARVLGLLMLQDSGLVRQLQMESEDLVDALLQLVNFCRRSQVQNTDTRRVHVNCCLIISLIMQAPHQNLQLVVSLDSPLLAMKEKPEEHNSGFLFLTVAGRPTTGQVEGQGSLNNTLLGDHIKKTTRRARDRRLAKRSLQSLTQLPSVTSDGSSNQNNSPPRQRKVAWPAASPTREKTNMKHNEANDQIDAREEQDHRDPPPTSMDSPNHKRSSLASISLATAIEQSQTPKRMFKMERFRVATPAFMHAHDGKSAARPVIQPSGGFIREGTSDEKVRSSDPTVTSSLEHTSMATGEERAEAVSQNANTLLRPRHMLEVLRSKRMPLASPAYFKRDLRDDDTNSRASTSRINVLKFEEWKRQGMIEEGRDDIELFTSLSNKLATKPESTSVNEERIASKLANNVSAVRQVAPQLSSSLAGDMKTDAVNTAEYKRQRLRDILSSPIEPNENNALNLRTLAERVNTSVMTSLESEIAVLRKQEQQMRQAMHSFIQSERDRLPLKFLFQLPGGAAYCRHRMRRAMALWILEFEDNQRRMALVQWKAFVDLKRFRERGEQYQQLAAMKRLRAAIDYILRGYLQHAMAKWVQTIQVMIWLDRDAAVRKIQGQVRRYFGKKRFLLLHYAAPLANPVLRDIYLEPCRHLQFQIPPCVREDRRRIWQAADLVQCAYRYRRFRRFLAKYKVAAAKIQALARMRAAKNRYHVMRRHIVLVQARFRRNQCYKEYQTLRAATLLVQGAFRSMRARRLHRLVLCAQRQEYEWILSKTLLLQRVARGYIGRCAARSLRRVFEQEFHAALIFQRCWYRRNNEWSTFLLLGCLREKEIEEVTFEKNILAYKRNYMARLIRRAWIAYRAWKRYSAARLIQCNFRRFRAQCLCQVMRLQKMAHRRIKCFFRVHHARRIQAASKLQFWWLRAVPNRMRSHLQARRRLMSMHAAQITFEMEDEAATLIQAVVRGHSGRQCSRREKSARIIQKCIRQFLLRRRIQHQIAQIKADFSEHVVYECVRVAFHNVYEQKMRIYNGYAMEIQRLFRGYHWRCILTRSIVNDELRCRMATRIQLLWRHNAQRRIAKQLLLAQKRKQTNPFRSETLLSRILQKVVQMSSVYYDPGDELKGMAVTVWLHRLGMDTKYNDQFQKSCFLTSMSPMEVLNRIRQLDFDTCKERFKTIGVTDDEDLEIMLTNLFASTTIDETRRQRQELARARNNLGQLKRQCDLALKHLQTEENTRKRIQFELEEILNESKEFRNPPKALQKRREHCAKELEEASASITRAAARHETLMKEFIKCSHQLSIRQELFTNHQENKEISAVHSLQSLKLIDQLNIVREMFLENFPGFEARALAFVSALEENQVSKWQLERFFQAHRTVFEVKQHMKELTFFSAELEMRKYDHKRFSLCEDILQFGCERMCDVLGISMERVVLSKHMDEDNASVSDQQQYAGIVQRTLLQTIFDTRKPTKVSERVQLWRKGIDALMQMNGITTKVQSLWRRRAGKRVLLALRTDYQKQQLKQQYLAELHTDYVTPLWEADRKKEQEELDEWLRHEALRHRREMLQHVVRFPYIEEWNDTIQGYVYYYDEDSNNEDTRRYAPEKPVYTIEEEDTVIHLQAIVRRYNARQKVAELQRWKRRQAKRDAVEREWNSTCAERSRSLTLNIQVNLKMNCYVMSWIAGRKKAQRYIIDPNRPPISNVARSLKIKPDNRNRSTNVNSKVQLTKPDNVQVDVNEKSTHTDGLKWKDQLESQILDIGQVYNKSVRADYRRGRAFPVHLRPPNAHGQAILDLVQHTNDLKRYLVPDAGAQTSLRYTKVELRFGWEEIRTNESTYYFNPSTNETRWDRPEYTFEEEYAAIAMQKMVRMLVAQNIYARELEIVSFVETVQETTRKAEKLGWIGFGLEGMSTAMFLSRLGLSKYIPQLSKAKLDDVMGLSEAKMQKLGWTKEEMSLLKAMPQKIMQKYPLSCCKISLSADVKHPFNFINSERVISQLVSQSFPNQQGRIIGLVKAIQASSTPISYRQLEMHLRKYAGRPDEALSNIGDIAPLEYATQEPQEREIYLLFLRCVERCIVFVANLKLIVLQRELSNVIQVPKKLLSSVNKVEIVNTIPVMKTSAEELAKYVKAAVDRYPARIVKGIWEYDVSKSRHPSFSFAQMALYLREAALERVLLWVRSALICQATFRMHKVREWYRQTKAFRRHCAIQIQCAWRVHCALDMKSFLESQQQSEYEQCFDPKSKSFYYFYLPTKEKMTEEPRDAITGGIIAYRPMIQDRVTKRWMLAWPHYHKKKSGIDGGNSRGFTNDDTDRGPLCSICNVERAARRCNECYSPSGDYENFCLVCFYDRHAPDNLDTSWHSYTTLHRLKTTCFHCVECRRFSTLRCLQCNEHYCERCFQRVHGRGHTRTAHKCEFYAAMAQVCVECEARVAFQLCLVCQDALCETCMMRTHQKGNKRSHELKLLKQPIDDGQQYCQQCHGRRADTRCEYCALILCQVCLAERHGAICPETELKQKRQELLGGQTCVECGKPADRRCETCGDLYCSVRWMGNPGCFERFHQKGKRADHIFTNIEVPAMTPEILALEEKVRRRRRQDALDAEREAKNMAAMLLKAQEQAEAQAKTIAAQKMRKKKMAKQAPNMKRLIAPSHMRVCSVESCDQPAVARDVVPAFCSKHLTLQHALELTNKDPLEAAKLLAQVEQEKKRAERTESSPNLVMSLLNLQVFKKLRSESPNTDAPEKKRRKRKAKTNNNTLASAGVK